MNRKRMRLAALLLALGCAAAVLGPAVALGAARGAETALVSSVGLILIAATVLAYLGTMARQNLLITYLAAGVVIGPRIGFRLITNEADVKAISEIGLILLLFIIGLDIDIRKLRDSGKALLVAGASQFAVCVALGFGFFTWLGFARDVGEYDVLYLSVCCAISSTTLVAKLLYDKFELSTLPGRVTLGVLLFQNIWVMLFFRLQPNLGQSVALEAVMAVVRGTALVGVSLILSRYALPHLFRRIAKIPELVLVTSLGWCFLIAGIAGYLKLSLEVGALIAGASLATFPYATDMAGKITSVRDFFLTLFFVTLGMQIPNPVENFGLLLTAAVVAVFVLASRALSLFPTLYAMGSGHRMSLLVAINLAQTSEIGLLVGAIGVNSGHIGQSILDIIIYVFVITSVVSSYLIKFSHPLQAGLSRGLTAFGIRDIATKLDDRAHEPGKEIALLGFYQVASSIVDEIVRASPELKDRLVVVDFNPQVHQKLLALGVRVIYGDISQMDTLSKAGIGEAKVVISTVPDSILRGTDNLRLIKQIQQLCPKARIIVSAESPQRALKMYENGADYVLLPRIQAAKHLVPIMDSLRRGELADLKSDEVFALQERKEIIN